MELLLPLLTAVAAGFLHALDPDRMAAVSTFVSQRPHPLSARAFGVRWGIGHSLAILGAGAMLVLLDLRVPEMATAGLEFGVGAMLVGLGLWLLWTALHATAHVQGPAGHSHPHRPVHPHSEGTFWVGMAHGLAGTAPLIALLPVTLISSKPLAVAYLALFGMGTVIGMGLYALAAGVIFRLAESRTPKVGHWLRLGTAVGSAALGVVWMATAIG